MVLVSVYGAGKTSIYYSDICDKIKFFGKNGKVIEPPELVKRIKENCVEILQMYKECNISEDQVKKILE